MESSAELWKCASGTRAVCRSSRYNVLFVYLFFLYLVAFSLKKKKKTEGEKNSKKETTKV